MNKYEAMFILNPELPEKERENLFSQIKEAVSKNQGADLNDSIFAEKRKLYFPINKHHEGLFYLLNFSAPPLAITFLRSAYKLNENILRVLITKRGE